MLPRYVLLSIYLIIGNKWLMLLTRISKNRVKFLQIKINITKNITFLNFALIIKTRKLKELRQHILSGRKI